MAFNASRLSEPTKRRERKEDGQRTEPWDAMTFAVNEMGRTAGETEAATGREGSRTEREFSPISHLKIGLQGGRSNQLVQCSCQTREDDDSELAVGPVHTTFTNNLDSGNICMQ